MKITHHIKTIETFELVGIVAIDAGELRQWLQANADLTVVSHDTFNDDQHRPCFRMVTSGRAVEDCSDD